MALTRRNEQTPPAEDARGSVRRFASRYAPYLITAGVLALGLIIFVLVWFQPQKIFLEETANEARPEAPAASPTGATTSAPATGTIAAGNFRSLEHKTTGRAEITKPSFVATSKSTRDRRRRRVGAAAITGGPASLPTSGSSADTSPLSGSSTTSPTSAS